MQAKLLSRSWLPACTLVAACAGGSNVPPPAAPTGADAPHHFVPDEQLDAELRTYAENFGLKLGAPQSPRVTKDGKTVLFLRAKPKEPKQSLFEMDLANGQLTELITATTLLGKEETLSPEEKARRERMRIVARGLASFEESEDGSKILVPLSGRIFVYDRAKKTARELPTGESIVDPHFSHDGKLVGYARGHDCYVIGVDGGAERALTHGGTEEHEYGTAEFIAQEELGRTRGFFFSPDDRTVLVQETEQKDVERLSLPDTAHPERPLDRPFYPRAGKTNAKVGFSLVPAAGGPGRPLTWDKEKYPYVAKVVWQKNAPLTLVVLGRLQKDLAMLTFDDAGAAKVVLEEHDDAWLEADGTTPEWIDGGKAFLWGSDRKGRWELSLRAPNGTVVRPLVDGQYNYRGVAKVDEKTRQVFFRGSPVSPLMSGLYVANLEGGAPKTVVEPDHGNIDPRFGGSTSVFASLEGSRSELSSWHVRSAQGQELAKLPTLAEKPARMPRVQFVRAGGKDEIEVALLRPEGAAPGVKLPIIDAAYGGPHVALATYSASAYVRAQWVADKTHSIVAVFDVRGTPNRGREWERALAGHLGDVPLDGHAAIMQELARTLSDADPARIGIFGWSFGGYLSALAAVRRPDVFKAAVAGAPVIDWRDYDTAYTERFLGLPAAEKAAYDAASVLTYVQPGQKVAPLLVVHGTADDNVFFLHSLKFTEAMNRAGLPYDFMPLPGITHILAEPQLTARVWSRMMLFLREKLRG